MRSNDDLKKKPTPENLAAQDALRSWLAIGRNWSLVFGLVALAEWADRWWWTGLCVLGIGTLQFALGEALLHEASHYNLFRSRIWNDRLEVLYALPFLTTMDAYRAEHLQHHGRLGKGNDHIVLDYGYHGLTADSSQAAWVWFGKPASGLAALEHLRYLWNRNTAGAWLKLAIFWVPMSAICAAAGLLSDLLLYWFLPLFAIFAPLLHWSEIADHYRTRTGTRSRTSRLHNLLWHNNGYHAIHHRFPRIPFHNLARAHRALGGDRWDCARGWWSVWRQISRPAEPVPEAWASFWPRLQAQPATKRAGDETLGSPESVAS
jgi:fatty acid desaturase